MNLARAEKLGLSSKNELDEVIEKLLNCLPPYADVKFFVDTVRMHYCFEDNYRTKLELIILGTGIPRRIDIRDQSNILLNFRRKPYPVNLCG